MKKVVFVTGTAQGIGLAVCSYLANKEFVVYGLVRESSQLAEFNSLVANVPRGNLFSVVGDVTDLESMHQCANQILTEQGRIDIVINNACQVVVGTAETCTLEEQMKSMDVNYFGAVRVCKAFLPQMRRQESGHIINISSVSGFEPWPHLETYVASKFALEGLSESMALHLSPWNIKVSLIEPGGVKTKAPANAEQGSAPLADTRSYDAFFERARKMMRESYAESMEPSRVASAVYQAITDKAPAIRYQVGDYTEKAAKLRFVDPTGRSYFEEKKNLLIQMGLLPIR